jgi:hypothetical protein
VNIGELAMNKWKVFRRIVIEETIRLMALEVVIGLPPIGIADSMGVDLQVLYTIAAISLSIPLVIWLVLIVIRTRKKEELSQITPRWQMDRKGWITLGVGTLVQLSLVLFYSQKRLLNEGAAIASLLIVFLLIVLGVWLSLRRYSNKS